MSAEICKYPQVNSIKELIETNYYVKTEYKKYIKHVRQLAEKIMNECIGTNINEVCEKILKCGCGIEPCDIDEIDIKTFWKDGYEINQRLYSDSYVDRNSKIQELQFDAKMEFLNIVIDDYNNFLNDQSREYINSLLDCSDLQTNFMLMEYDKLFDELDSISKNISLLDQMRVDEIIRSKLNFAKEFIARVSLNYDDALYEILDRYLEVIAEKFENKEEDIIKEILKSNNEKYMIRIDDIRTEINSFKIVYGDLIETFVDEIMKDVNVTCTIFHFAKWFVDGELKRNENDS